MSSLPTPDRTPVPDDSDDAQALLAQGIRALALKKHSEASELLSRAVEAFTTKYGELAPECAEPLVLFGKALLGNAIAMGDVLGGPQKDETEEAVQNAAAAGPSSAAAGPSTSRNFSFGGDGPEDDEEGEEQDGDDEEDEEGAGDTLDRDDELETAFSVLDMARTIYSKMQSDEAKLKLADVHKLIGEVAQESAQFDNAVTEYSAALAILKAMLPPYDRALSELHMLCALAYDFLPDSTSRAVKHAEQAKDVLLLKLDHLEKVEPQTEKETKEIDDIKDLMGALDEKIEDLKIVPEEAPKTEAERKLDELLQGAGNLSASGAVNNLNSLVKKKAKAAPLSPAPVLVEEGKPVNSSHNIEDAGETSTSADKRKAEDRSEIDAGESKKPKVDE
ncbi:hypothetical protein OIO90_003098 [Microbotryomycetes sp. JL221]|nr:hypothetical protein OIO90_003098 [Microbotryomycetes sp. JL221]